MRKIFHYWHKIISKAPAWLAKSYLQSLSLISRSFLSGKIVQQIRNSVNSVKWPAINFPPMQVSVGRQSSIQLIPHLGEFDGDALFSNELQFEKPVFIWLEENCSERYDLVIEIGANVGVYTCFLGKLLDEQGKRIIAFEPSPTAYSRLQANLQNNKLNSSLAVPAAVADSPGWVTLYEPLDHLTNGSLDHEFACYFTDQIKETIVPAVDAGFLENLVNKGERVLLKIDVEGYEPVLLASLEKFLQQHQADIIIEVLKETEEAIRDWLAGRSYTTSLFTEKGLEESDFCAKESTRDWLFECLT